MAFARNGKMPAWQAKWLADEDVAPTTTTPLKSRQESIPDGHSRYQDYRN